MLISGIQRFNYPSITKESWSPLGSASMTGNPTFTGNTPSKPTHNSSNRRHNQRQTTHNQLVTRDGQDFYKYWHRQGLHNFQIDQMIKQTTRHESANYIKSNGHNFVNFELNLERSKNDLPEERPGTPHEQSMLALQQERLSIEPQADVQAFLARLYLYCTRQLRPENSKTMRAEVTKYAVPLSPGKEFYRGMLLSADQVGLILAYAEGDKAQQLRDDLGIHKPYLPYPQLAKHLLHGFPIGGGKYSHHGITSITTLPNMAAKYANRAYYDMDIKSREWDWKLNLGLYDLTQTKGYIPVVVTIVNNKTQRAKGFVIEKNYYKAKHEIILDSTNDYMLAENPLSAKHGMLQLRILASHN